MRVDKLASNKFDTTIKKYLGKVLLTYTNYKEQKLETSKYVKEIFLKNVDIYGFISTYFPLLSITNNYIDKSSRDYKHNIKQDIYKTHLLSIIEKYCFNPEYAVKQIPVDRLVTYLNKLNF